MFFKSEAKDLAQVDLHLCQERANETLVFPIGPDIFPTGPHLPVML